MFEGFRVQELTILDPVYKYCMYTGVQNVEFYQWPIQVTENGTFKQVLVNM
jgi:hypothetical protein